jgi:23S rRNA (uracil1939-C5)-methyltransferase
MRVRLHDARFPRFVQSLELFTNETDLQVNVVETSQPLRRDFFEWCESVSTLDYQTSLGTFRVGPRSFFQVNRFLVEKLVEAALSGRAGTVPAPDGAEGNTAMSPSEGKTALDLYAGVGLFAIPLARLFASVTAVEAGSNAVRDLEFNAESNAVGALRVEHSRVEDYIANLETTPDFILADPPRAGLGKEVVKHLNRLAPPRVTIVSCDPATLARDLAALPGYSIERLTMVDLFPQTYHMETVVHLQLKGDCSAS